MAVVTLRELATRLARAPALLDASVELGMKAAAVKVRDTAVKKFGTYQPAVGNYPAWERLKPATIKRKSKAGGGEDPLIGHYPQSHEYIVGNNVYDSKDEKNAVWSEPLRDTIETEVAGWQAQVGTADPLGKYHEYGTSTIPPRPFLRPALFENEEAIKTEMETALVAAIRKM